MKALEIILVVTNLLLIAAIVFICIVIAIEENKEKSACQKKKWRIERCNQRNREIDFGNFKHKKGNVWKQSLFGK